MRRTVTTGKHILIITDIARAFILFGFLFVQDENDVWLLYTLTTLLFAVSGFFSPARSAILPDVTSPQELGTANTLGAATWSVMLAVGAAIGGLTTGLFGSQTAFIIDGFTFFLSAAFLFKVRLPGSQSRYTGNSGSRKTYCLRLYVFGIPIFFFIALHKAAISLLLSSGLQIVLIEIAKNYFVIGVGGAISLGMMYCMNGVGSGIGPILARTFGLVIETKPLRGSISLGYLIAVIGIVIMAPLFNFEIVLLAGFVRSVGGGIIWVFFNTIAASTRTKRNPRTYLWDRVCPLYTYGWSEYNDCWDAVRISLNVHTILWGMSVLSLIPALLWSLWQIRYNRIAVIQRRCGYAIQDVSIGYAFYF